jgi:hypothetical protein
MLHVVQQFGQPDDIISINGAKVSEVKRFEKITPL